MVSKLDALIQKLFVENLNQTKHFFLSFYHLKSNRYHLFLELLEGEVRLG